MGKLTGFIDIKREKPQEIHAGERISHWEEYLMPTGEPALKDQAARCMDCGTPFCQMGSDLGRSTSGCPLYNLIPEWNELVYQGKWHEAYLRLIKTNNFPEFTARACPAPCEGSCTAGVVSEPVAIKSIERAIIDKAFEEGWATPRKPLKRTGLKAAVIGSGPAGLAAADELNQAGYDVTVLERDDRFGGLLMYGIPNMKIEKKVVERRIRLLEQEGIQFKGNVNVGVDVTMEELRKIYDAVILCTGAGKHRELDVEGRGLSGIYPAMTYLTGSTKHLLNEESGEPAITAKDKHVIVIGGGDTGADCVATALRQGCKSIVQFGKHGELPKERGADNPWPEPPDVYTLDYAYAEAKETFGSDPRQYQINTTEFLGDQEGHVRELGTVALELESGENGKKQYRENESKKQNWDADLVLIAIGFEGAEDDVFENIGVEASFNQIKADNKTYQTNLDGVFAAGDARRGQSLIVWAIQEGRKAAESVDRYLREKHSKKKVDVG
ncbi:glutamate synthase (NADPH) small subunit [Scopulibacillus darangshiensis]|uniref:Glutamate synthase (NADPH) small subunit n=1 Tax=Scopulibacillus darangshiensis TaxID=442528 RepID=A0A4R2NKA0_9BACL|nr:glutamate synthase subunit beta [Scopulibacillus darangshiensis]TCP21927.1 glutamate synthase (NADPH) small subunit [Scopulibacillus darangshiensis]